MSSPTDAETGFIESNLGGALKGAPLGTVTPEDEYLHPPAPSGHHSATETSYFGFNIPEHALNAEIYMWFHPVLQVMSASVYIWRGANASTLECDYVNHYSYLPFPADGIRSYSIPDIGLDIEVLEPLKSIRIDFADAARGVSFNLQLDAIMLPGVRPNSRHFTQAMKTRGSLDLYGEQFTIDGYFSRDHSWGDERPETSWIGPPLTWMVGVFGDDLAFNLTGFDSPEAGPHWLSQYPMEPGKNLLWGYIFRDGLLLPVTRMRKHTVYERDRLVPRSLELEIEDSEGMVHNIRGTVNASMPWQTWQNMNVHFCQTRWECAGRIGWGDTQDIQTNDYVRRFAR